MSNDAPDIKILFNDNGLVIERHPDGELRLETEDYNSEDVGIGVANIVSNYNYDYDTPNFIDNELIRNIEITPRQLRLSDRKKIVYELSGGGVAWGSGAERYRHDFDKTYEDLWKKDAIKLKKSIQKFKTLGELMDYFYEEYIKDNYFYDDAIGNSYDYDTQRDEEETYSKDTDYIKEYAQNSYTNKSESEIIDELYNELLEETEDSASKNGLDFDEDIFKEKIQEIVHETYKGINEQSLALFKKGGKVEFEDNVWEFNQGDCGLYAIALHRVYGFPIYVVTGYYLEDDWGDEREMIGEESHVVVKLPNGNYLDHEGELTEKQLLKNTFYGSHNKEAKKNEKIELITEKKAKLLFRCGSQESKCPDMIKESEVKEVVKYIKKHKFKKFNNGGGVDEYGAVIGGDSYLSMKEKATMYVWIDDFLKKYSGDDNFSQSLDMYDEFGKKFGKNKQQTHDIIDNGWARARGYYQKAKAIKKTANKYSNGGGVDLGKYYVLMDDGEREWYNVKRVEDVPNVYFAIGNVGNAPQAKEGEVFVHRHNALRPLHNKDGSKVEPMPQYAGKSDGELELFKTGGDVVSEISKSELESKVGRKLDGWNDDVVIYNGNKYKKCFLRPYYKIA
ncbi:MAG: hypothetical protein IPJ01_11060 [Micavibrio sp.]|nr:hypothetical protein [Micavibrio sp.]